MNTALFNSSLGIINLERVAALLANRKSTVVNRGFIYNTYIIKLVRQMQRIQQRFVKIAL